MLAEALTTGGVLAVALAGLEVAKNAVSKRNGNGAAQIVDVKEFVKVAAENGTKIDQNERTLGLMLQESKVQTNLLTAIKVTLQERRD